MLLIVSKSLHFAAILALVYSTAQGGDFVVDQEHYTANFVTSFGGQLAHQEFTPVFSTLDVVDVNLGGFHPGIAVNIREGTVDGPIVGSSSTAMPTLWRQFVGSFVQFHFEPAVVVVPENLYVLEVVCAQGLSIELETNGGFQWRPEHAYSRGRLIFPDGTHSEDVDIAFRTGSRRLPGVVYATGFESLLDDLPYFSWAGWQILGHAGWVTPSDLQPNHGANALQIHGRGVRPTAPGLLIAGAVRDSDLNPRLAGNAIVSMQASMRLDGPNTNTGGGSDDDLISANFGVTDEAGATTAELVLSSNGNAYAFVGENRYRFETAVTLGEYHTIGIRLDYLNRIAEFFLEHQSLGVLPFETSGHHVFGKPILSLTSLDTPGLDPALYSAWFDDFSIQQKPVPEPASAAMLVLAAIGLFSIVRVTRTQRPLAAGGLIIVSFSFLTLPGPVRAAMFHVANVPQLITAIGAANQSAEPDSIAFTAGATFTLTDAIQTPIGRRGLPTIAASGESNDCRKWRRHRAECGGRNPCLPLVRRGRRSVAYSRKSDAPGRNDRGSIGVRRGDL